MAKSIFAGLKEATASMDANYERPGHYYLLIDACKTGTSRKGDEFCAIEKTCVHALDDDEGAGHKAGQSLTHMIMMKFDSSLGNIKAFIAGAVGLDQDDIDVESAEAIFADKDDKEHDQPLSGIVVECKNRNIKTKAGGDFTVVTYVRAVPAAELIETLAPEIIERYFPNDVLTSLAEADAA